MSNRGLYRDRRGGGKPQIKHPWEMGIQSVLGLSEYCVILFQVETYTRLVG